MDLETEIVLGDKNFRLFIPNNQILLKIEEMARQINQTFVNRVPEILVIMDGAESFAMQLLPLLCFKYNCHFTRIKTYKGMKSDAHFNIDPTLKEKLSGKEVLILEDIVDSGHTVYNLMNKLEAWQVKNTSLASLFIKPNQLQHPVKQDFIGFELGPDFIVGFGMDYNEKGRNLKDIYRYIPA